MQTDFKPKKKTNDHKTNHESGCPGFWFSQSSSVHGLQQSTKTHYQQSIELILIWFDF